MTNQEALNIVDEACAKFKGTRGDHKILQTAMAVLSTAIAPVDSNKPDQPKKDGDNG